MSGRTGGPRRRAIKVVGVGLAILVAAGIAGVSGLTFGSGFGSDQGGVLLSQVKQGMNPANLNYMPMFVYRRGDRIVAVKGFAPGTPGQETAVAWCPAQGFFENPVDGSKFGPTGLYLAGPGTASMDRFPVTIQQGQLYVNPNHLIRQPPGSVSRPVSALPACDWRTARFAPGAAVPSAGPTPQP